MLGVVNACQSQHWGGLRGSLGQPGLDSDCSKSTALFSIAGITPVPTSLASRTGRTLESTKVRGKGFAWC